LDGLCSLITDTFTNYQNLDFIDSFDENISEPLTRAISKAKGEDSSFILTRLDTSNFTYFISSKTEAEKESTDPPTFVEPKETSFNLDSLRKRPPLILPDKTDSNKKKAASRSSKSPSKKNGKKSSAKDPAREAGAVVLDDLGKAV
jgi:hypothetical protein